MSAVGEVISRAEVRVRRVDKARVAAEKRILGDRMSVSGYESWYYSECKARYHERKIGRVSEDMLRLCTSPTHPPGEFDPVVPVYLTPTWKLILSHTNRKHFSAGGKDAGGQTGDHYRRPDA